MIKAKINADKVIQNFKNALYLTQDFTPLFVEIVGKPKDNRKWTLVGSVLNSFLNKSGPNANGLSGKWPDLNEKYFESKIKKFGTMPTLVASGRLFDSLVNASNDGVNIMEPKRLRWGTSIPYAAVHNFGGGNNIPRRSFLGISEDQKKVFKSLITEYVKQALEGNKNPAKAAVDKKGGG